MNKIIAYLFPGQGSQHVGMGKEFYDNFEYCKDILTEGSDHLHFDLKRLMFDGPESDLKLTKYTQPALLVTSQMISEVLRREKEIQPHFVAGHSLGEYSALLVAESISFQDAITLVHKRGLYMQEAVADGEGGMVALIGKDFETAKYLCNDVKKEFPSEIVEIANLNSESQIVISGTAKGIEIAQSKAKSFGFAKAVILNVSAPFHCSLMKSTQIKMAENLEHIHISKPKFPYVANVDANIYYSESYIKTNLIKQICNPVLWYPSMQTLLKEHTTHFIEVGSLQVLTTLMKRINRNVYAKAINKISDLAELKKDLNV